jgi:predicted nucleic-acid-binding protein
MIGIDTNVLIRYIVRDEPGQSAAATRYLEKHVSKRNPAYISQIVLCEIVWVLKRAYGYDKKVILQVIRQILGTKEFMVENAECARQAFQDYQNGEADFSDYLIGLSNRFHGCDYTVTFDRKAAPHPAFRGCV